MKLTGMRANKFIDRPPDNIIGILLFGPDRGLVKERSDILVRHYIDDPDDVFAVTVLTADDLSADPAKLSDELSALSLLGGTRLIRVRLDHERAGLALSKIIKTFDANPGSAAAKLIIEAADMTPRSPLRKACEAAGHFAAIGCYADSTADIGALVRTMLNDTGIQIEREALDMWVPLLMGDRGLARGEIEKMILYKGYGEISGASVSSDDIRALAAGGQNTSIDAIIMAAMSGNIQTCDAAFMQAVEGKINAAIILRSLQRHLTRLMNVSAAIARGSSASSAMKSLRPPVFGMQERAFSTQVNIWPYGALAKALAQSLEVERSLKTAGAPTNALTERLLLALAQYAQKRN